MWLGHAASLTVRPFDLDLVNRSEALQEQWQPARCNDTQLGLGQDLLHHLSGHLMSMSGVRSEEEKE